MKKLLCMLLLALLWIGSVFAGAMVLKIDDAVVPVVWEKSASVQNLKEKLPLTLSMTRYGGFEQVGPLGFSVVSDDLYTETNPGDIVLYASSRLVIFFGQNAWEYTRLGHIQLSEKELRVLLNQPKTVVKLVEET